MWLLSLSLSSYIYFGMSGQSHYHVAASWTATRWQETHVHGTVITLEFRSLPSHSRRHKYTDLWEHLSSSTKFECENSVLLCYLICRWNQVWMKVIQQHNILLWKYCTLPSSAAATIVDTLIPIQLHFIMIIFQCNIWRWSNAKCKELKYAWIIKFTYLYVIFYWPKLNAHYLQANHFLTITLNTFWHLSTPFSGSFLFLFFFFSTSKWHKY